MSSLIDQVKSYIEKNNLIESHETVIVGLSGGPDSVFLLHVLKNLQPHYHMNLIAAHLDHGWRATSHEDAAFCQHLCAAYDVTFIKAHASEIVLNRPLSGSKEDLGRQLRRQFFESIAHQHNAHKIALGHHQDDQIETFFIRLIRGSGLSGLATMRPHNGQYIRPLLAISKNDIITYLDARQLEYLTDESNVSDKHLRNRIRNDIIPALQSTDHRFKTSCLKTIENLTEAEEFLEKITETTFESLATQQTNGYLIDLAQLRSVEPLLQKRVLILWFIKETVPFTPSSAFFDEIMRFLNTTTGGIHQLQDTWAIEKKHQKALIKK